MGHGASLKRSLQSEGLCPNQENDYMNHRQKAVKEK